MSNNNKKIIGYSAIIILIFLIPANMFVSYFLLINRETNIPNNIEQKCNIKEEKFKERKIFIIEPKDTVNIKKEIFYFHGGAYVAEATKNHWEFLQKLAIDLNARIYMPDYPLTPKNNYKDVYEMVEPFYLEYIKKVELKNLYVMGDSAGGGLALGLMEKISKSVFTSQNADDLRNTETSQNVNLTKSNSLLKKEASLDNKNILPQKIILISPWLDVRLNNPEIDSVQKKDKILNKNNLQIVGQHYAGSDGINSYLVNPIDGDLSKLNNITILTGTNDILNPDVHKLKEIAEKQGVTINIKEYEEANHIWFIENNSSKELIEKGYNDLSDVINE